jgi:hypothetical protein
MPRTSGYMMLLFAYLLVGGIGLGICSLLALLPPTRRVAARLAGGIVGSFPGVFLFQVLAIPALIVMFAIFWLVLRLLGPLDGLAQIVWNVSVIASMLGMFALSSAAGFVVGWRVGTRLATGMSFRRAVRASRLLTLMSSRVGFVRRWLAV